MTETRRRRRTEEVREEGGGGRRRGRDGEGARGHGGEAPEQRKDTFHCLPGRADLARRGKARQRQARQNEERQ